MRIQSNSLQAEISAGLRPTSLFWASLKGSQKVSETLVIWHIYFISSLTLNDTGRLKKKSIHSQMLYSDLISETSSCTLTEVLEPFAEVVSEHVNEKATEWYQNAVKGVK